LRVSIALATYNGAAYLSAQLQSFVEQERMPDELVVSDDCSTDDTVDLLREFSKSAPFEVKILLNNNRLGYVGNFNRALGSTSGDMVFLSDQDDVWLSQKIHKVIEFSRDKKEVLLFMNDAEIVDCLLSKTGLSKLGQLLSAGYPSNAFVMGCCCAIRRDLLDLCLPIPAGFSGHDSWIVAFAYGLNSVCVLEEVLQLYRRHDSNESTMLANRTKRVGRLERFKLQIENAMSNQSGFLARYEIEKIEELYFGCRRSYGRIDGKYDTSMVNFQSELESQLQMLRYRYDLRRQPIHIRLYRAVFFLASGSYGRVSGIRSFIRDLMG
tara:strand:- start:3472 stop:4443 length:972 start_codon:yes stop_codon:yes gene_type:complete